MIAEERAELSAAWTKLHQSNAEQSNAAKLEQPTQQPKQQSQSTSIQLDKQIPQYSDKDVVLIDTDEQADKEYRKLNDRAYERDHEIIQAHTIPHTQLINENNKLPSIQLSNENMPSNLHTVSNEINTDISGVPMKFWNTIVISGILTSTFFVGLFTIMSQSMTLQLNRALDSSVRACCFTYMLGMLIIACMCIPNISKFWQLSWSTYGIWSYMSGIIGAITLLLTTLMISATSIAVYSVSLFITLLFVSLCIDTFGFITYQKQIITAQKILACLLILSGITMMNDYSQSGHFGFVLASVLTGIVCGCGIIAWTTLNQSMRINMKFSLPVLLIHFIIGFFTLLVLSCLVIPWSDPDTFVHNESTDYMWFGGVFLLFFIASNLYFPPAIGMSSYMGTLCAGMIFAISIFQANHSFNMKSENASTAVGVIGVVCGILGVILIGYEQCTKNTFLPELTTKLMSDVQTEASSEVDVEQGEIAKQSPISTSDPNVHVPPNIRSNEHRDSPLSWQHEPARLNVQLDSETEQPINQPINQPNIPSFASQHELMKHEVFQSEEMRSN